MSSIAKNKNGGTGWLRSNYPCNVNIGADDYCSLPSKIIGTISQQLKKVNGEHKQGIEDSR